MKFSGFRGNLFLRISREYDFPGILRDFIFASFANNCFLGVEEKSVLQNLEEFKPILQKLLISRMARNRDISRSIIFADFVGRPIFTNFADI